MSGIIGCPELSRPPSGQCLRLIPAGEEGKLFGVARTDGTEPLRRGIERFIPFDLAELPAAAWSHAHQRLAQARRGVVLHDAGGALGAQHAAIYRMPPVTLDIADPAAFQVDLDPAAARAHVTRRIFDLVGDRIALLYWRIVKVGFSASVFHEMRLLPIHPHAAPHTINE